MSTVRVAVVIATMALVVTTPSAAQELTVEVRAGQVTDARGEPEAGATLAPAVVWRGRSAVFALGAEGVLPGSGGIVGTAGFGARAWSTRSGPGLTFQVDGFATGSADAFRGFGIDASPRVGYTGRGWSAAAGPHLGLAGHPGPGGSAGPRGWPIFGSRPGGSYEVKAVHGVVAELRAGFGPFRWSGDWRTSAIDDVRWSDLQTELVVEAGRLAFAIEGGRRRGAISEEWAGMRAAVQLSPAISLVGRGGRYVADPVSGRIPGTRAQLGVRIRRGSQSAVGVGTPPAPAVLPDGRVRLVLRADPGAEVKLSADWTNWRPVAVRETEPGLYTASIHLPPGKYRFAFVVDGIWRTPDGYVTEPDGYGGRHAVVRVASR